jgi:hypothetical protein
VLQNISGSVALAKDLKTYVWNWIRLSSGWFDYQRIYRDLGIETEANKTSCRSILHRLCKEGLVERDPKKDGMYRLLDSASPEIPWQNADPKAFIPLKWVFGLEELVNIYPKNIIVVAGAPNAGKTAFCLNFIEMNQHRTELGNLLPIHLFSSEMGEQEMKVRLSKFPCSDWSFKAFERSSNFADAIKPDKINIVDYLEVTDNFYLVSSELKAIHDKLKTGIAIITLQKKRGAELGRGAEFSLEKPRLYLSMDNGKLTIIKAKNWSKEGQNPNGMTFNFKLVNGTKFIVV